MRLNCPNCGEQLSLNALIEHDAAREAILLALQFPAPLGKLLMQYVSLFKPGQRALSMDRFTSILSELLPMIQAAQIERSGRAWPAPLAYWQQAIETMLISRDKLTLPIKSHGYLLEIIVGLGNKAESHAEKRSEQGRKYGALPAPVTPAPTFVAKVSKTRSAMPAEARAVIRNLTGRKDKSDGNQA